MTDKKAFGWQSSRPLSILLMFVGWALVSECILVIFFQGNLKTIHYPVELGTALVGIFIGLSLVLNTVYGRFVGILYCGASFLGGLSFFSRSGMENASFKNMAIFENVFYGVCSLIFIVDQLRKKKSQKERK